MNNEPIPALVTLGPSSNSLGVVRTLGERGVTVVGLNLGDPGPARYCRRLKRLVQVVEHPDSAAFPSVICGIALELKRPVFIPTRDRDVIWLSKYRKALEPYLRFLIGNPESVGAFTNKARFARQALQANLPVPRTSAALQGSALANEARKWEFPFLIKPVNSYDFSRRFFRKGWVVDSPAKLNEALETLAATDETCILQEFIPAKQYFEAYVLRLPDGSATLIGYERVRQFPSTLGSATYCRVKPEPDACSLAAKTLEAFDWHGIAAVELIQDYRTEKWLILEVNPRTTLQNRLAAACGYPLEFFLYSYLIGEKPVPPQGPPEPCCWVDEFRDLPARWATRRGTRIPVRHPTRRCRTVHSLFSRSDPLPAIAAAWYEFRRFLAFAASAGKRHGTIEREGGHNPNKPPEN
ncbi:MAG: hypothetical protein Kow00109_10690 [Acidobacteriota bacterium]